MLGDCLRSQQVFMGRSEGKSFGTSMYLTHGRLHRAKLLSCSFVRARALLTNIQD